MSHDETCIMCGSPFEPVVVCDECASQFDTSPWIKCADRLPAHEAEVIFVPYGSNARVGFFDADEPASGFSDEQACEFYRTAKVRVWMPLPEIPKE